MSQVIKILQFVERMGDQPTPGVKNYNAAMAAFWDVQRAFLTHRPKSDCPYQGELAYWWKRGWEFSEDATARARAA